MSKNITKLRATAALFTVGAIAASGYILQNGATDSAPVAPVSTAQVGTSPAQMPGADDITARSDRLARAENTNVSPTLAPMAAPGDHDEQVVTRAATQPVLAIAPALSVPQDPDKEHILHVASGDQAAEVTAPKLAEDPGQPAPQASCETGFTAFGAPGAMVDLTIEAPCRAGEVVDVFHAGLRFTTRLDENGLVQVSAPAMTENALFDVLFSDGTSLSADLLMLTVSDYDRTALDWKGDEGFDLYALENGAEWGSAGHVSATNPYEPNRAINGEGGFLVTLGDVPTGYHAMVYSWPERLADSGQKTEVSVEASVTNANCGREIAGTILRIKAGGPVESLPLSMAVPGCDAVGEYLVLKNLPEDRKLASK